LSGCILETAEILPYSISPNLRRGISSVFPLRQKLVRKRERPYFCETPQVGRPVGCSFLVYREYSPQVFCSSSRVPPAPRLLFFVTPHSLYRTVSAGYTFHVTVNLKRILITGFGFIALQTLVLFLFGQPPTCTCGTIKLWVHFVGNGCALLGHVTTSF